MDRYNIEYTNDTSIMTYCTIQYSSLALSLSSSYNISINNCKIIYNDKILNASGSQISFENTLFYKNQRNFPSIYLYLCDALFENCRYFNNGVFQLYNSDNTTIINSIFANNANIEIGTSRHRNIEQFFC